MTLRYRTETEERGGDPWRLETSRLVLRRFRPDDVEPLHAIWSEPEVGRFIDPDGWPPPIEAARRAVDTLASQFDREGVGQWAVILRGPDSLIGYCGFKPTEEARVAELVYGFGHAHWGRGHATEAARTALDFGFRTAGLTRVVASAMAGNLASIRVLEKLEMTRLGVDTIGGHDEVVFHLERSTARGAR